MIGLIRKSTNELEAIVATTDGYDLILFNMIDIENPLEVIWENGQLKPRPLSKAKSDLVKINTRKEIFANKTLEELETYVRSNNSLVEIKEILITILLMLKQKGFFN
jgi:hypothetical protein